MNLNDISQEEFEYIEAYINDQLTKNDLIEFEHKLKNDENFSSKVNDIKTILNGLETQALKEQLDVFHNKITNDSNTKTYEPKVRTLSWKKIAVAAVLIISLGSFWLLGGNSNDRLYAKYFTPDPGLPTTMSSNSNFEFYDAMVNYKQGDYKTAISKWETLQKAKPNNDTLNYFIGVAHLANGNETKAIDLLNSVIELNKSSFIDEAHYYLGLAHLKADNINLAKENLSNSNVKNSKALISELTD